MFSCVYFVFKKASKPLEKEEKTKQMRRVLIVYLIGVPINIAMLISLTIDMYAFDEEYHQLFEHDTELEEGATTYFKRLMSIYIK